MANLSPPPPPGSTQTPTVSRIQLVENNERDNPRFHEDGFCHGFTEIRNLVWAKKDPVFSVALEEWDRKERLLSARLERRGKSSVDLVNQIFNLVGFYSVFQGVVLTAVSQLASNADSQCGKVWFPIVLSLVAAVVALAGLWVKFKNLIEFEDSINLEKKSLSEVNYRRERLLNEGEDFRFYKHTREPTVKNPKSFGTNKILVLATLIVVTGIFIVSYLKTKLINNTDTKISVKLNNSGILLKVKDVEEGGYYTISIDPNATFREYWCAQTPGNNTEKKAILTSDDCALWREISITRDQSRFSWTGTKSRSRNGAHVRARSTQAAPVPSSASGTATPSPTLGISATSSTPNTSAPGSPPPSSTRGIPAPSSGGKCHIL